MVKKSRIAVIDSYLPVATNKMLGDMRLLQPDSHKSSICSFLGRLYINPRWQILSPAEK